MALSWRFLGPPVKRANEVKDSGPAAERASGSPFAGVPDVAGACLGRQDGWAGSDFMIWGD
jgi:hypothetical protein